MLYFEDSRALHMRFPQLAHNVIARVHGTWPALTDAGVGRVEELIKAQLVNAKAETDTELPDRILARLSVLHRVVHDDEILAKLRGLQVLRTADLKVKYRAELFGYPFEKGARAR